MSDSGKRDLSVGEWAVLALLAERPAHGFAIARLLAPEGDVGQIWSLPRPLVYRALDKLELEGLVEAKRVEPGKGPRRRVLATTRIGKREVVRWLTQPVAHVRDVRSLLMLKLLFLDRAGKDAADLLREQRRALAPIAEGFERQVSASAGFERTLLLLRRESALAVLRFIEALLSDRGQ